MEKGEESIEIITCSEAVSQDLRLELFRFDYFLQRNPRDFFSFLTCCHCNVGISFAQREYGPNSAASKISMDHAHTYPSISRYKGQCFFEVSSLYTCHDQRETPQNCCWNIWNTTQSRFTFNISKVFFTKPCLFCFPPHVGWIFVPQDQREILQERQLINNPVTWSLMAHKKMNLMTSRKLRVGGSQGVMIACLKIIKITRVSPLEDIYTHIYIYTYVSEIVLIRKFPHIYLWAIKYRLEIPKMNLHGRSKSRRWIFHLLSFFYYLIHHPQE